MTQIGTANVNNGVATTNYRVDSDAEVGDFKLKGTYVQNDTYKEATSEANFKVRIGTVTTVENVLANYDETATFTANVKYNNTVPVTGGQVQFKLGNTVIGTSNVSAGVATLDYVIPSTANTGDSITANYLGTDTYGVSETLTAGTLTIRDTPSLLLQNVIANRGSSATITATIQDANGENIDTGVAELYVDGTKQNGTSNASNGEITFTYDVPSDANPGTHTIKVVYLQNDSYISVEYSANLIVRNPVTVTAENVSGNPSEEITLRVLVKDMYNQIATSGQATITVNGSSENVAVGNDGYATRTFIVPSDATGTINFSATYAQNDTYESGATTTDGVITIRQGVSITVQNVTANQGDDITLVANVKDTAENNITTGEVTFEVVSA